MKWYKGITQIYTSSSWRDTITKVLLALVILVYPFNAFPHPPTSQLMRVPIVFLFLLNIDRFWNLWKTNKYLRMVALLGGAWFVWMNLASLFAGGLEAFGDNISGVFKFFKFFILWYLFMTGLLIFPYDEIKGYIYWAFVALFGYTALYACIELLYFADVAWAKDFLGQAIHCFMKVSPNENSWWPPVFWTDVGEERCRSVFEEPAYYALLLVFCTLFFSYFAWVAKKTKGVIGNFILATLSAFLLVKTLSAAGAVSLGVAVMIWMLLAFCFICRMEPKIRVRLLLFILMFVGASVFTLMTQRHSFSTILGLMNPIENVDKNRSARAIHLAAELKLVSKAPICGYGAVEYRNVMTKALREENKVEDQEEVKRWVKNQNPPPLNRYTEHCVRFGIPGLLFFVAWLILPIFYLLIKNFRHHSIPNSCVAIALTISLACLMLAANTYVFCYFIFFSFPTLFVMDSKYEKNL